MSDSSYDCLCAGIVVGDFVCAPISHLPAPGELVTTEKIDMAVGGCAANVSLDLARLGHSVAILGRIGNDACGDFVRQQLETAGVDCDALARDPQRNTSSTLVVNVAEQDRRFIHDIGANAAFDASTLTDDVLGRTRVLYLGGYCLADQPATEVVVDLFQRAQQLGVTTVLDVVIPGPGEYWKRVAPILPFTDVFCPNDDEARAICGLGDPYEQAVRLRNAGAGAVVVTCGESGSIYVSATEQWNCPSFDVPFRDGTGSGDAFVAGFLHGLATGATTTECLQFGSALGASCVQAAGATTGVFTREELADFLSQRSVRLMSLK